MNSWINYVQYCFLCFVSLCYRISISQKYKKGVYVVVFLPLPVSCGSSWLETQILFPGHSLF